MTADDTVYLVQGSETNPRGLASYSKKCTTSTPSFSSARKLSCPICTRRMDRLNPSVHKSILSTGSYVKLSTVSLLLSVLKIIMNWKVELLTRTFTYSWRYPLQRGALLRRHWRWKCGCEDDVDQQKRVSSTWHRMPGLMALMHCKNSTSVVDMYFHQWEAPADGQQQLSDLQEQNQHFRWF